MKNRAINALVEMGMPADIKGFQYIVDAMCLLEKNEYRTGKTTDLYCKIGEINGVKPQNVERAIRHALEVTLTKGYLEAVEKYLSLNCTTNGSQLHLLYMRLKQQEEEGEA